MLDDARRKGELEKEHKSWLQTRATHCATLAKVGGSGKGADKTLEGCFASFDKQREASLGSMRLTILAGQPALAPATTASDIAVSFTPTNQVDSLAVSPDGRLAAVGTISQGVEIYDLVSAQKLRVLPADKAAAHLSFSRNGRLLATASRFVRGTKIWDVYSGKLLREYGGSMGPIVLLADNRHLLHADGEKLVVYDYLADKPLPTAYALNESIFRLALSPDGRYVATVTTRGVVSLWEWLPAPGLQKIGESRDAQTNSHGSSTVVFSGDGSMLYSATGEGTLNSWSIPDLKRQRIWPLGGTLSEGAVALLRDPERLVLAGFARERGSYLIFVNPKAETGAVLDLDRGGRTFLAHVPGSDRLLAATYRDLRRVQVPAIGEFVLLSQLTQQIAPPAIAAPGTPPAAPVHLPALRAIANDAVVEAIGVYEGGGEPGTPPRGFREHAPRNVQVAVGRTSRPIVLVLSSYEPVNWRLSRNTSTQVRHILLSGPQQSTVQGAPDVEVTRMAAGAFAYELNSPGFGKLNQAVAGYLGKGIDRFQGAYAGAQFSIGADVPQVGGSARAPEPIKCADARGQPVYVDRRCEELGLRPFAR